MIPYFKANGIWLIPWAPLHQGDLARPISEYSIRKDGSRSTNICTPLTETDEAIITRVEEVAKKKGWEMSEIVLAWIDAKVTSPIVRRSSIRDCDAREDANAHALIFFTRPSELTRLSFEERL